MDVGNPSNAERLIYLMKHYPALVAKLSAGNTHDQQINQTIVQIYRRYAYLADPHTAVGLHQALNQTDDKTKVVAATAHPYKFRQIIEPLISQPITPPPQANKFLKTRPKPITLPADYPTFKQWLKRSAK